MKMLIWTPLQQGSNWHSSWTFWQATPKRKPWVTPVNLYHVFIDFKKAFDRVWHEALWATMRKHNINASIIRAIENLYDKAQSAVLFNGSTGECFRTTVGIRQGCLLSPTLLNIFLERTMCEALDDHDGSVSIGGRLITDFPFADDIVVNAEEEEAGILVDRLDTTTPSYKMEIGPDKTKVMTNNSIGFQREIKIKGQRLEEVENFKYLGANISNERSKPEILSRIAQITAAFFSRLNISLVLRLSWCGRSSYLPSFMPVRAGPWQQKTREGSTPVRWDAIGDFWTFPTKTMWWKRRFATESRMQLECIMIF